MKNYQKTLLLWSVIIVFSLFFSVYGYANNLKSAKQSGGKIRSIIKKGQVVKGQSAGIIIQTGKVSVDNQKLGIIIQTGSLVKSSKGGTYEVRGAKIAKSGESVKIIITSGMVLDTKSGIQIFILNGQIIRPGKAGIIIQNGKALHEDSLEMFEHWE